MSYVIVKYKVADYARWKPIFDADGANRQASGSKGGQLFRSGDDPNEVVILSSGIWSRPASLVKVKS